jgi:hypothetical protein
VGIRDQPGDIDEIHGHESVSIPALAADKTELTARATSSDIGHPEICVDGGERIVRYFGVGHCRRLKKG